MHQNDLQCLKNRLCIGDFEAFWGLSEPQCQGWIVVSVRPMSSPCVARCSRYMGNEPNLYSLWQTQTTVACFHKPVCLFLSQYLATILFLPSLEVRNVLCVSMPEMKSQDWFFCLRRIHLQKCEYLKIMIKNGLFWGMQAFFWCQ